MEQANHDKKQLKFSVEWLLWLALILALGGSLKHLASVFASVDGNAPLGWVQAVAIDAGVFALAYQIRIRRKERHSTKRLWLGVFAFTGISVYGNLAYGLQALNNSLPDWISATKPVVLAATLPLLVLFLAELLGDDREHAKELARPAQQKPVAATATKPLTQPAKNAKKTTGKNADKKTQAAKLIESQPGISGAELARQLKISDSYGRLLKNELAPQEETNGTGAQQQ